MNHGENPPPYSATPVTGQPQTVIHAHMVAPHMVPSMAPNVIPVVMGRQMASHPCTFKCPSCLANITTRVVKKTTLRTHLFAALLCIIGCWPCVFIPYCTDSCMNSDHFCPNCNAYIGTYMS